MGTDPFLAILTKEEWPVFPPGLLSSEIGFCAKQRYEMTSCGLTKRSFEISRFLPAH